MINPLGSSAVGFFFGGGGIIIAGQGDLCRKQQYWKLPGCTWL